MDLKHVERRQSELLQFLIILIMIFLGTITFLAWRQSSGPEIPFLTILSLLACLYVMSKERALKALQRGLVAEILEKDKLVEHEKDKSASLDSRLKELSGLYRAISAVNSVVDEDQTLDACLEAGLELVGGDRGTIMLLSDSREELRLASILGIDRGSRPKIQRTQDCIEGWVASEANPILVFEAREDRVLRDLVSQDVFPFAMCVPLQHGKQMLGVMSLGGSSGPDGFTQEHLRCATIFGQHASVAIKNARLSKALRQRNAAQRTA